MNASNTPAADPEPRPGRTFMSLHEAIGRGLRHARENVGVTQDTIARRARRLGLSWDRAKVAALERGEKPVNAEELLVLLIVAHNLGIAAGIDELLGGLDKDSIVSLAGRGGVSVTSVGQIMQSGQPGMSTGSLARSYLFTPGTRGTYPRREDEAISRAVKLGFRDVSYEAWRNAQGEAGETEAKIARRFGESVLVILAACVALWGHSLTYRRDEEIAQQVQEAERQGQSLTARQVQALRGHVTRRLVGELEDVLMTDEERYAEEAARSASARLRTVEQRIAETDDETKLPAMHARLEDLRRDLELAQAALAAARADRSSGNLADA